MIIYKTTNLINNKIYIGQTITDSKYYLGSGLWLKRSIKKYGRSNFKRETLETCSTVEELNEKEVYWINKLNARDSKIGYNIDFGGAQRTVCSEETKKKISKTLKGHKTWNKGLTKETDIRVKVSSDKRKGKSNSLKGVKRGPMSEERKKLRYKFPKGNIPWNRKPVIATNIKTGEQFTFPSSKEGSLSLGVDIMGISCCLNGKQKRAGNFHWSLKPNNN